VVVHDGGLPRMQLAERTGIHPGHPDRVLARLYDEGWVTPGLETPSTAGRYVADPARARLAWLSLEVLSAARELELSGKTLDRLPAATKSGCE